MADRHLRQQHPQPARLAAGVWQPDHQHQPRPALFDRGAQQYPNALQPRPHDEHLLPVHRSGAAGLEAGPRAMHRGIRDHLIAIDSYVFEQAAGTLATTLRTGAARSRPANLAKTMHLHYHPLGFVGGLVSVLSSLDAAGAYVGAPQSDVESTLTERYQTTVPQPVRRALGLRKRDRIRYSLRANGEVVLQRVSPDPIEEDPALAPFLALLERDIASRPERLQPIGADLIRRLQDLVGGIEVDLDEALPDDETI